MQHVGCCRTERAFTLIEILVVMVIVAIVLSTAIARFDISDVRRLENAAERLTQQLGAARDEAITRGQPVAFSSDGQGYQFWIADPAKEEWLPLLEDGHLSSGNYAAGVSLRSIQINGTPRPLGEKLIFSMTGLSESFFLTLAAGEATLDIQGDVIGRMEILRAH